MNIILIGMPGCGKSTVGVLLAKALQLDFIDSDLLIQKKAQMSLQELIDSKGLEAFFKVEEEVLCGIDAKNTVISTGGSAVYSKAAMEHLKKDAIALYISLPYFEIESRLTNIKTRGVAMSKGQTLEGIFNERTPLYEKYADITLSGINRTVEETVEAAVKEIERYINK